MIHDHNHKLNTPVDKNNDNQEQPGMYSCVHK